MKFFVASFALLVSVAAQSAQPNCYSNVQAVNNGKTANGAYSVIDKGGEWTVIPLNAEVDGLLANAVQYNRGICFSGSWVKPSFFAYSAVLR